MKLIIQSVIALLVMLVCLLPTWLYLTARSAVLQNMILHGAITLVLVCSQIILLVVMFAALAIIFIDHARPRW